MTSRLRMPSLSSTAAAALLLVAVGVLVSALQLRHAGPLAHGGTAVSRRELRVVRRGSSPALATSILGTPADSRSPSIVGLEGDRCLYYDVTGASGWWRLCFASGKLVATARVRG